MTQEVSIRTNVHRVQPDDLCFELSLFDPFALSLSKRSYLVFPTSLWGLTPHASLQIPNLHFLL